MEDIFDVVNASDEVIDRKPRSEVHRLGLMHRAVHILVFNRKGEVFLQKRSMLKDRQAGAWDSSCSGHVDSGEDYDTATRRELGEELGLRVPNTPARLFKIAACEETDQEHVWVYKLESDGPFTLSPEEIERGEWARPEVVDSWIRKRPDEFAPAFRFLWGKYRDASGTDASAGQKPPP